MLGERAHGVAGSRAVEGFESGARKTIRSPVPKVRTSARCRYLTGTAFR